MTTSEGGVGTGDTILEATDLVKEFPIRAGLVRHTVGVVQAVSGVSFSVRAGETLGLVGESGCGKSTTGRLIMRLIPATSGSVFYRGRDLVAMSARELRGVRGKIQFVFQDPYASLNPRMTVQSIVSEPMRIHGTYRDGGLARIKDLMSLVGLNPEKFAEPSWSPPWAMVVPVPVIVPPVQVVKPVTVTVPAPVSVPPFMVRASTVTFPSKT